MDGWLDGSFFPSYLPYVLTLSIRSISLSYLTDLSPSQVPGSEVGEGMYDESDEVLVSVNSQSSRESKHTPPHCLERIRSVAE